MYSPARYIHLRNLFLSTHHVLLSLPTEPLLHIALRAGLSALKTPACHSVNALRPSALTGAPVCPICSTELNELAKNVPYAHHTTSSLEDDPVALPTGRVMGRERLRVLNEKIGTKKGLMRDPTNLDAEKEGWQDDERNILKVYIS
jgi:macrophage erythroblast attacher